MPSGRSTVTGFRLTVKFFSTVRKLRGKSLNRSSVSPILLRSRVPWYAVPGASGLAGLKTRVRLSAHSASPFTAGVKLKRPCVRVRLAVAANSGVRTTWSVPLAGTVPEV